MKNIGYVWLASRSRVSLMEVEKLKMILKEQKPQD